jgi:hypothetical protein
VEFEPLAYATSERPRPEGSVATNAGGWSRYWSECLEEAGIRGLEPWAPGWWLVPIARLRDPEILRVVIAKALAESSEPFDLEQVAPLKGGYILSRDGATVRPGCCGDLANLADWRRAAAQSTDAWTEVWIGHPWTYVRASGDLLTFAEPVEGVGGDALRAALSVPRHDLAQAIERASAERDALGRRLLAVMPASEKGMAAEAIVNVLLHGHR